MWLKFASFAFAIALCAAAAPGVRADVVYTVFNPVANNFVLFVYDSPTFITTNTTVNVAQLAFASSLNTITSVEFFPSSPSPAHPGMSEIDVIQALPGSDQVRYYPQGTFTQYGVTAGLTGSFGAPNSMLRVEAPEPSGIAILGSALAGLAAFWRYSRRKSFAGAAHAKIGC